MMILVKFVVGFFSFLILLCCEGATAAFRASLVPIHATFGITTFMLAVATCLTGITEKAIFTMGKTYSSLPEEALVVNALAMALTASAIVVAYICLKDDFKYRDIKFVVGFFSFLILLCCEGATAAFRASLVPIHATFGITTFMLAVATCLTGITEKAIFTMGKTYSSLPEEALVVNALAMALTASAIVVAYICLKDDFKYRDIKLPDIWLIINDYSSMPEEGIVLNALAMVLVALGILLSYAVRRESFRSEAKTFVTERL
ncbi:hypothetical protein C0J52_24314 [Blattella germanica]|nr:hypothetical protein C0J52_24314 [Blattella germanica]